MATTHPARPDHPPTPTAGRVRPPLGRRLRVNRSSAELVEDAIRAGEGLIAAEGPLVVRTGKHTGRSPQDKFIVDEPTTRDKIWWGEVNRPITEANYDRLRARLVAYCAEKDLYAQDLHIGADPDSPAPAARLHRDRVGQPVRSQPLPPPGRRGPRRFRAELHDHLRPVVQGRSRHRGDPHRDRDPGPPRADGDPDRRHRVRGRDQEVGVHRHEPPHARRGRPADALLGQRRQGRRLGRLLRTQRNRQDHAVRGPRAQPHRRRRARLGPGRPVQLRGRLLREDDPALADVRARHLPDDPALRDRARERRPGPRHARAGSRLGAVHREHPGRLPAALHRQRRPDRDDRPAADRRAADGRRLRRAAADLAPDPRPGCLPLHQRATRPSWPAPRWGSRSPRPRSAPVSGPRSCRVTRVSTPGC